MSLTIKQRVDRGIAVLETYLPDGQWALKLDTDLLDMNDGRVCILGQLHPYIDTDPENSDQGWGHYLEATSYIEYDQDLVPEHDDGDWTADYGFQSAISEWQGDESEFDEIYTDLSSESIGVTDEYELLAKEWIKRIEQIREASDG